MSGKGKVAVVTGASDGLGAMLAHQLAGEGYHVWLLARNEAKLQGVVDAIRAKGGEADFSVCDVTAPEAVEASFAQIGANSGQVDLLISNAGVWLQGKTVDASTEEILSTLNTNLLGIILVTRAALPLIKPHSGGQIVNVISNAGVEPNGDWSIYTASKYGARGFTDSLKLELAASGIRVTGVYPAGMSTAFFQKAGLDVPPGQPWMMPIDAVAAAIVQICLQPEAIVLDHVVIRKAG